MFTTPNIEVMTTLFRLLGQTVYELSDRFNISLEEAIAIGYRSSVGLSQDALDSNLEKVIDTVSNLKEGR